MMENGAFLLSDAIMNAIKVFIYIFEGITVLYTINIALFLKNVFKFAKRPDYESLIPFYNIFALLKIVKMPSYYGLLFFIPIANLGFMISLNKKLCEFFDKNPDYLWGMIFVPFVYMSNLVSEKGKVKREEIKPKKAIIPKYSMKEHDKNLLTDKELENLNKEKEEKENIDSIFKADTDLIEDAKPYKAGKQKVKIIEDEPVYERETIKKVESVKARDIQKERKYIIDEDTNE